MKIVISWSGSRVLANAEEAILVRQTRVRDWRGALL